MHHCSATLNILLFKIWYHIHFEDVFKSPPDKIKSYIFPWWISLSVTMHNTRKTNLHYIYWLSNEWVSIKDPICSSARTWLVPAESTCSSSYLSVVVLATGVFGFSSGDFVKLLLKVSYCEKRYIKAFEVNGMSRCITHFYDSVLLLQVHLQYFIIDPRLQVIYPVFWTYHTLPDTHLLISEIKAALRKNNR